MAEQINRARLEEIIEEELKNVDEGFFDRVMARSKGNASALKQLGQNVVQGVRLAATGKADITKTGDPKLRKGVTMAVERIKQYDKKFEKMLQDMTNDLMLMFGPEYKKMPALTAALDKVDKASEVFAQAIKDVGNEVQTKMTQGASGRTPDEKSELEPAASPEEKARQMKQYQLRKLSNRGSEEEE